MASQMIGRILYRLGILKYPPAPTKPLPAPTRSDATSCPLDDPEVREILDQLEAETIRITTQFGPPPPYTITLQPGEKSDARFRI